MGDCVLRPLSPLRHRRRGRHVLTPLARPPMSLPRVPAVASACRRLMRVCNRSAGYPLRSAARIWWSAAADPVLTPPQVALPAVRNRVLGCSNHMVDQVELSGLEPLTSCMPSGGSTSTRIHLCRSPSSRVPASPPASAPVAVLSCCTAAIPAGSPSGAPDKALTSANPAHQITGAPSACMSSKRPQRPAPHHSPATSPPRAQGRAA